MPKNDISVQYHYQQYGTDSSGINFGGNIFESYNTRISDYNHQIGQGDLVKQNLVIVQLSYLVAALTNTKIFIRYNHLDSKPFNGLANNSKVFNIGISSRLWQDQQDY